MVNVHRKSIVSRINDVKENLIIDKSITSDDSSQSVCKVTTPDKRGK